MRKKNRLKVYALERSPLWQLRSQKQFAELLGLKKSKFKKLVTEREFFYKTWNETIDGKQRQLAVPTGPIRRIHEQLKRLLDRIQKPEYLFSPRSGYSPTMNAALHADATEIFKLDVRQFYPSTTREHIFRFCRYWLQMSDDVAGAFSKLATFEGRAPFGSPLSPILCFFAHRDAFDNIQQDCVAENNKLSLWVDDLTISGSRVSGKLVHEVKRSIEAKGLSHHKEQRRHKSAGIIVTGAFISNGNRAPANKHHLKMKTKLAQLDRTVDLNERLKLVNSLLGMTDQSLTVYTKNGDGFKRASARRQWLQNEKRRLQAEIETFQSSQPKCKNMGKAEPAPWL